MKMTRVLLLCGLGVWAVQAVAQTAAPTPTSPQDQISYASGVMAIRNFTKNDVAFDLEVMIQGMRDAMANKALAMNEKQITVAMNQLQTDLRRSMAASHRDLAEKNRKRGVDFMAAYKQKPGTSMLSNGVAYRVIKAGDGAMPGETDSVITRYRGSNVDGVEFDATEKDKTSTLRLSQVIMGWRHALKQMPVGSRWELVIPSALAYGERGVGQVIGPNETLVFDVELIEIHK